MVVLSVLQALHSVSVEVEVQVPINSSPFSKEAHSYPSHCARFKSVATGSKCIINTL